MINEPIQKCPYCGEGDPQIIECAPIGVPDFKRESWKPWDLSERWRLGCIVHGVIDSDIEAVSEDQARFMSSVMPHTWGMKTLCLDPWHSGGLG